MKTIYILNKVLIVINLVLFLTIYFGLLFLPITGITQLVCFLFFLSHWKKMDPSIKKHLRYYGISVLITLGILLSLQYLQNLDLLFWLPIIFGGILSIYFLLITERQSNYSLNQQQDSLSRLNPEKL